MVNEDSLIHKVMVIGDPNVGKSTLIERFVKKRFNDNIIPTVGVDFYKSMFEYDNKPIILHFWDPCGAEKTKTLMKIYYRGLHGLFLVYDITNEKSLFVLNNWLEDVNDSIDQDQKPVIILVGNKCDLTSKREVTVSESKMVCEYLNILCYEVTSKTGKSVDELLYLMVSEMDKRKFVKKDTIVLRPSVTFDSNNHTQKSTVVNKGGCC